MARIAALLALVFLATLILRGPDGASADTPTPTTSTPVPLSTGTPTLVQTPSAATLMKRSVRAMATVRQLHADGIVAESPAAALQGVHLIADCDLAAMRKRIRLEQAAGVGGKFVEFVLFKHRDWARSTGHPAWERDTNGIVESLIPYFYPACPIAFIASRAGSSGTAPSKPMPTVHLRTLNSDTVDGVPVWHLRLTERQKKQRYSQDFYVDQATYRWMRITAQQTSPRYFFDMHYSHFNEPVAIPRPIVGSTP